MDPSGMDYVMDCQIVSVSVERAAAVVVCARRK